MTVVLVIVGKAAFHATVKKENMNTVKQWAFGVMLLVATPFLLMFGIIASLFIKLPLWAFMLYNEVWNDMKEKRKNVK